MQWMFQDPIWALVCAPATPFCIHLPGCGLRTQLGIAQSFEILHCCGRSGKVLAPSFRMDQPWINRWKLYIYIYRFLCIPAFPVNNKINEKWHLSKKSHVRHPLWHTGLSYFLQTSHRSDDSVSRYSTSSPTPCGCGCEESRTRSKYLGPYHQCERHRVQFAGNLRSETKNGCLSGPLLL